MNLYVGNLSFQTREEDLKTLFSEYGEVNSVKIITDRATGKSKGFAFVEMADKTGGMNAIRELNNKEFDNRSLKVNEAREREDNGSRGGGGGGFNRNPRY